MYTLSQNSQNEQENLKFVEYLKGITYNDYCRKVLNEYIFPEFLSEFTKGYITIKDISHEYAETYILNKFLNKLSADLVNGSVTPKDSMLCYITMKNILSSPVSNSIQFASLDNDNTPSVVDTSEHIIDKN